MSDLEKYLRGELGEGKATLPEVLTPEILKGWREKPHGVRIETTNRCNAQCLFCGHPHMKRKKGNMTQKLFKKIVDDCREWNPRLVKPYLHGELFQDPKWKKRLEYIDKRLKSPIYIETNGTGLDQDAIDFLLNLQHISTIAINFSGSDPKSYKKIMGLDYQTIVDNINNLIDTCRTRARFINIHPIMVTTAKYQTVRNGRQFRNLWGPLSHTNMFFNYGGVLGKRGILHTDYCQGLREICILRDGKVSLCWMDLEGDEILGDANKESLLDIWNSDRAIEIRELHKQGKRDQIDICNRCDFC